MLSANIGQALLWAALGLRVYLAYDYRGCGHGLLL